jgi:shikimate dehydrogenase
MKPAMSSDVSAKADANDALGRRAAIRAGLIGAGIQGSASPSMHMDEGAHLGVDYRYDLFDLDLVEGGASTLPSLLSRLQAEGYAGVNITHPCKQAVIPLLDELSADADIIGAVNTVVFRAGRRVGHNTDWSGFAQNFEVGLPGATVAMVTQLGAGGAGAAVAYAILKLGALDLKIHDTDPDRAERLAATLAARFPNQRVRAAHDLAAAVRGADGLVNCTPVGMEKYPGTPVPAELLTRPEVWVADIVYFPLETELLRAARLRGCRTLDGGGMAVFQAAEAIKLITGLDPDPARMMASFSARRRATREGQSAIE